MYADVSSPDLLFDESTTDGTSGIIDRINKFFEKVDCASGTMEEMVMNTNLIIEYENFKSTLNLMKSNLKECDKLDDIEYQIM